MKKAIRTLLSICIVAALITGALALPASAAESDLKIFVATDMHLVTAEDLSEPAGNASAIPGDPLYSHASPEMKLVYETAAIIKSMLADFAASDSDYLLISGDLTDKGTVHQHETLAGYFHEIEEQSGKSILVVPGNHDVAAENPNRITVQDFKENYADFGYNEALSVHDESGSYSIDIGNGYRLLAIDSLTYKSSAGLMKPGVVSWIEEQVALAKADGKKLLAMQHHGVVSHFRLQSVYSSSTMVDNYEEYAEKYADWGIKYLFTGHVHCQSISAMESAAGNRLYDIETGALASVSCPYRIVDFSSEAVTIETGYVDSIDINDLPDGYNDEQLALAQSDFVAYSEGLSRAGASLWIDHFLKTEGLASSLGVEAGTTEYEQLDALMQIVRDGLALPLYDEAGTPEVDSMSELAALGGVEIPASEYETVVDVLYPIVMDDFFGGKGNTKMTDDNVVLLLTCVKGVLSYAFLTLADDALFENGLGDLFDSLGVTVEAGMYEGVPSLLFAQTAANTVIAAILTPIIEGVVCDPYAPADNEAVLEAYGDEPTPLDNLAPLSFIDRFYAFIQIVFSFVETILGNL